MIISLYTVHVNIRTNLETSEKLKNTSSSLPKVFSPSTSLGEQVIVNQNEPYEPLDEELVSIWNNTDNSVSQDVSGAYIAGRQNSIYFLAATGKTSISKEITWRIDAKRNALTKVAVLLTKICPNKDKAKTSFVNGELKKLTYNESGREVKLTFRVDCNKGQ